MGGLAQCVGKPDRRRHLYFVTKSVTLRMSAYSPSHARLATVPVFSPNGILTASHPRATLEVRSSDHEHLPMGKCRYVFQALCICLFSKECEWL
jgi:hypothetical protein